MGTRHDIRADLRISSPVTDFPTYQHPGDQEPHSTACHGPWIAAGLHAHGRSGNDAKQRQAIGQIGAASHRSAGNRDGDGFTDGRPARIIDSIGLLARAEHLGEVLAATTAFLMATAATALLHFDDSLPAIQGAHHAADRTDLILHSYHRRSGAVSRRGRNLAATASRARNMRERTVPMGQFMICAISS